MAASARGNGIEDKREIWGNLQGETETANGLCERTYRIYMANVV